MGKCGNMLSITRPSMKGDNMFMGIIASSYFFILSHIKIDELKIVMEILEMEEFGNHLVLTMW